MKNLCVLVKSIHQGIIAPRPATSFRVHLYWSESESDVASNLLHCFQSVHLYCIDNEIKEKIPFRSSINVLKDQRVTHDEAVVNVWVYSHVDSFCVQVDTLKYITVI